MNYRAVEVVRAGNATVSARVPVFGDNPCKGKWQIMRRRFFLLSIGLSLLLFGGCSRNAAESGGPEAASEATTPTLSVQRGAPRPARKSRTRDSLDRKTKWYRSEQAKWIASNVLLYQRDCGGWWKNIDIAKELSGKPLQWAIDQKKENSGTIDNGATYQEMRFLAKMYEATRDERYRESFLKGVDFLLDGQYPNGGWPQVFPDSTGYSTHITFNDNAITGVMLFLRDIAQGKKPYQFVDAARRERADKAVAKAIDCILKCQVVVDGVRTVWCAQHDEKTLQPAKARTYELPSLSGAESVGIVAFLMTIEHPSSEVVQGVEDAVRWFDKVKIVGKKLSRVPPPPGQRRSDVVVVDDPSAPPLWARFYEIGTNRPFFSDRDGVVKYDISEIGRERRVGYSWYGRYAKDLLARDYPKWREKWTPGRDVLAGDDSR
jgi:PelA/Pel-15E family pectate lyase